MRDASWASSQKKTSAAWCGGTPSRPLRQPNRVLPRATTFPLNQKHFARECSHRLLSPIRGAASSTTLRAPHLVGPEQPLDSMKVVRICFFRR